MLYLTTHSTHFIYGYMASDIWLRTILIVRKETRTTEYVLRYLRNKMHRPFCNINDTRLCSIYYTGLYAFQATRKPSQKS